MPPEIPIMPFLFGHDPVLKPDRRDLFAGDLTIVECVPGDLREADLLAAGYALTAHKVDPDTGRLLTNVWAKVTTGKGC